MACRKFGLAEVEDVLGDVVAERVLDQTEIVHASMLDKLAFLLAGSVVHATLQDAAVVTSADS